MAASETFYDNKTKANKMIIFGGKGFQELLNDM